MKKTIKISHLELTVLSVFAERKHYSVKDVQNLLQKQKLDYAYTTVMTIINRLYTKGYLHREKEGRCFLYTKVAISPEENTGLLKKITKAFFSTKKIQPILTLIDEMPDLSQDEIKLLENALKKRYEQINNKES